MSRDFWDKGQLFRLVSFKEPTCLFEIEGFAVDDELVFSRVVRDGVDVFHGMAIPT